MEPSARELRAAKRAAKRESKRQAAGPAIPSSGTGSDGCEVGESSRELRAAKRAAKRESQRQAAGPTVPSSGTGSDGREVGVSSGGSGARPEPALTATASGRRARGGGSVSTRLVARRLQSAAREARESFLDDNKLISGGQQNFYTITHDYKRPVVGAGQTSAQVE